MSEETVVQEASAPAAATEPPAPEPVLETGPVRVGDKEINVQRFRGLKGILAGALVARIMKKVPDLNEKIAELSKKFRENNYVEITRGMKNMDRFAFMELQDEDFKDGPLRLPLEISVGQQVQWVFPELWEVASEELQKFFALLAITNKELEDADDADEVEAVLKAKGKEIIREGDLDELVELALVSWNVLKDQLMRKRDRLEKLSNLPIVANLLSMLDPPTTLEEELETETLQTSTDELPTSSTDSPDSTDGADGKPSTESPGESSSSSMASTTA